MLSTLRARRDVSHGVALALIACALLLRIVVPQGWMPVRTVDGWRLTICSGMGPMQMSAPSGMTSAMPGMHHDRGDQDRGAADHPCAFAGFALALDEPPLLALDVPKPISGTWLTGLPTIVGVGRGLAAPPPPATGPPLIH